MWTPLAEALELLLLSLLRRGWAVRAALVTESGEVLAVHRVDSLGPETAEDLLKAHPRLTGPKTNAHAQIEVLEAQRWLYVDLGNLRLMVELPENFPSADCLPWLARELHHLGVLLDPAALVNG